MKLTLQCLFVALSCLALAACDHNESKKNIHKYIKQVKQDTRINRPIAVPKRPEKRALYSAKDQRDPFLSSTGQNKKNFPNTKLRAYQLQALRLVGIVKRGRQSWAMLLTPDGKLHKITTGNRVGNQQSMVKAISPSAVQFATEVTTDTGPQEKITTLKITNKPK